MKRRDHGPARMRLLAAGVGAVALLVAAMALIPIQRPAIDFGTRQAAQTAHAGLADLGGFSTLAWPDLMPPGWNPREAAAEIRRSAATMSDSDPRAASMQKRLRDIWDSAPTHASLDGSPIRLPGYVVATEWSTQGLAQFLLVPYFGACIHAPPPPSNQIVLVRPSSPVQGFRTMDTVWVSGTLRIERTASTFGYSSYALDGARVDKYTAPRP